MRAISGDSKTWLFIWVVIVITVLLSTTFFAMAATGSATAGRQLVLLPSSQLWLEGTSTLHPYSSRATRMSVKGMVPVSAAGTLPGLAEAVQSGDAKLELTVAVKGLHSERGGLDGNLYKAMKAEVHPQITFRLTDYRVKATQTPGVLSVWATGRLEVAGVEKTVELESKVTVGEDRFQLEGARELKMSDFGITPPTMFMGALKTDDRVVIHYKLVLGLQ